jgi:predicted transposase
MKLTMLLKLVPTPEQTNALFDTMRTFNAAANYAAERAFTRYPTSCAAPRAY